jgi:hypothetical protein
MRQLSFGARGRRGSGTVLSLSMLRVSRAVGVACTNCGEGEGAVHAPAKCSMTRRPFRKGSAQATEIAFGSGSAALKTLKHSASLGLTTVDAA